MKEGAQLYEPEQFSFPIRIYYEDTDAGGIVYYANYLKFFERARTEWLRHLGIEQDRLASEQQIIFVVRRADLNLRHPARFNDLLQTKLQLRERKKVRVILDQSLWRDDLCLCTSAVEVAAVHRDTFKPLIFPAL